MKAICLGYISIRWNEMDLSLVLGQMVVVPLYYIITYIYYSIRSIPFIIQPEGAGGCTVIHPGSICRKHVAADAVFPFHASDGEASHPHGDDKPQIVVPALLYEPTAGTISGPAPSFHMRPCPISLARRWKQCRAPTGAKERPKNTSPTLAS